jgi:hypothetical protein
MGTAGQFVVKFRISGLPLCSRNWPSRFLLVACVFVGLAASGLLVAHAFIGAPLGLARWYPESQRRKASGRQTGARRRAPKLTVTRACDSLCQNGCYPMAALSCWFSVSVVLVVLRGLNSEVKRAGGGWRTPARAPLRSKTPGQEGGMGGGSYSQVSGAGLPNGRNGFQTSVNLTLQCERI